MNFNQITTLAITALLAYLAGSIPFGLLIGLARGVDVRKAGSCNIGATNVLRTVGKPWGVLAFLLDFAKGVAGAIAVPAIAVRISGDAGLSAECLKITGGFFAVAGHNWPVWLKFRGGKGVATSAGMLLALIPMQLGIALLVWIAVLLAFRYVSLASICAAVALAASAWIFRNGGNAAIPVLATVLAVFVIARHHANIARLLSGTENRFSFRK